MGDIKNKLRVLKLKEIFENETDEINQLSIEDIVDKLAKEFSDGYKVNKKAIIDDISALEESRFFIIKNIGDHNKNLYSHQNRLFELYELRMLIDAVSSARFITNDETKKLISKIKKLTSKGLAKNLQNQIFIDDRVKSEDTQIKFSIDKIHTAIAGCNKIDFKYGNYDVYKNFNLHHDGQLYLVEPYALVWNNDYYYLIGSDGKREDLINYRVDRMRSVSISENKFIKPNFDAPEYIKNTFNMYSGKVETIEIEFDNHLINAIIDRFGKEANIIRRSSNSFTIRANAAINKGLIRWILTWGSDANVISPRNLVDEMRVEATKMKDLYK